MSKQAQLSKYVSLLFTSDIIIIEYKAFTIGDFFKT